MIFLQYNITYPQNQTYNVRVPDILGRNLFYAWGGGGVVGVQSHVNLSREHADVRDDKHLDHVGPQLLGLASY